jgi:hypothetical protein
MSLFDVDKTHPDRGSPEPNRHDLVSAESVKAHQTLSSTYKTDASAQNVRMAFKNGMIIWYDDQNRPSSVYGYVPGYTSLVPVLAIAKYGFNVFTDVLGVPAP